MDLISLNIATAKGFLPNRLPYGNKGTFGKVLLICGSKNMVGCCSLATEGALRSGAGLVTLAFPDCLYMPLTSRLTENLFLPLATGKEGSISIKNTDLLLQKAEESDVVMFGCGIGVTEDTKQLTYNLISNISKPLIIDADGLNCLSENTDVLKSAKCPVLLTPHPGEMSRLTSLSIDFIQNNRVEVAKSFSEAYNVTVLLKGHETVICNSNSEQVYINKTGNTGLSKGGSGDLLSGIIAGLTASQKGDLFKSATIGAFIHGLTADILKEELTEYAMLPTDCLKALPEAFKMIQNSQ